MASTILLDPATWDLLLDADGRIALAAEPYSLAQDAASAIRTFIGECWYDVTVGVDWFGQVLGKTPSLGMLKARIELAARSVPDVATATCYISAFTDRTISGQIQVTSSATGQISAADFAVVNPQGG
jgi:hypothetical protein